MTSPTPIDGLVWSYHRLGWSTRRIAGEVQTSQATVVRILDRMKKDPPAENTVAMDTTPPSGLHALLPAAYDDDDEPRYRLPPRNSYATVAVTALVVVTLLLAGAVAGLLAAANGGLVARGLPGPAGAPGRTGPPGPVRSFTICVRYSSLTGSVTAITAPVRGGCGTATLVRIP